MRLSSSRLARTVFFTCLAWLVLAMDPLWAHGLKDDAHNLLGAPSTPQMSDKILAPGQPIVLGMSVPLTGPTKHLGQDMVRGAWSFINHLNRQGGVHGRKVKLMVLDDGYEPARTIANTRRLLDYNHAFALFGYVGTPTTQVALPIAARAGVPLIAPFTGAAFLRGQTGKPGVVVNVRASYMDETAAMVEYLVDKRGLKRIALLVQNDAYGNAGRIGVQKALAARGLEVGTVAKYERNTSDVASAVSKVQAAAPQAVIVIGTAAPMAAFVRESHARNFRPLMLAVSFVGARALRQELGPQSDGILMTQTMPSSYFAEHPLVKGYAGHAPVFDAAPSDVALEGYFAAAVTARILQENGPDLSRGRFMQTAEGLGTFTVLDKTLTFTPQSHDGTRQVYFIRLEKGREVPLDIPTPASGAPNGKTAPGSPAVSGG